MDIVEQPHLEGGGKEFRSKNRMPCIAKILEVNPAQQQDTDCVSLTVVEVDLGQRHFNVPIAFPIPGMSITPEVGSLCILYFIDSPDFECFVLGFLPDNLKKYSKVSPSFQGEQRSVKGKGVDFLREDGSQYQRRMNQFEVLVTGDSEDAD